MLQHPVETSLPDSAQRVADLLQSIGHPHPVVMLAATGKTSAEAAAGLGCEIGAIAKSIIFKRVADEVAVLVIASGATRVDEAKVAALLGPISKADAKFVKQRTGYAIGGVCPIGHLTPSVILIEQGLLQWPSIWAAAGHPHAVFNLTPQQLQQMTGAPVVDAALLAD